MADTITKGYIGTGILQREDNVLGRDAVHFAEEDIRLNGLAEGLQFQINKLIAGGVIPIGAAGGELAGFYPNPTLVNSAVIGKVLTGFAVGAATTILATDTILQAFGKTQGQINALVAVASPLTTKGDIFTYAAVNARLPIGANATILMADSAATTGNKWIGLSGDATIATTGVVTVAAYKTVEDEGIALTQRTTINFAGAGVTATDSGGKTLVTIPGGAAFITSVTDTATVDLDVTLGELTANVLLTSTEIGFGDGSGNLTSSSDLTWVQASKNFNINGTIGLTVSNSANVFYAAQGNVGFWYTGAASTGLLSHQGFGIDFDAGRNEYSMGDVGITNNTHILIDDVAQTIELTSVNAITALNLAGVGTRMVTASATGVLATAAIPTNTITAVSDTATIDLTITGTTLSAIIVASSVDTTQLADNGVTQAKVADYAANTFWGNNTSGAATPADIPLNYPSVQTLTATLTWTAGVAPSGATSHSYNWIRVGNMVTAVFNISFATSGTTVTNLVIAFPADMPAPVEPTGFTSASDQLYQARGFFANSLTGSQTNSNGVLRRNSGDSAYEFSLAVASGTYKAVWVQTTYFTS